MQIDENALKNFAAHLLKVDLELISMSADVNNLSQIVFQKNDENQLVALIECNSIFVNCNGDSYNIEVNGVFPVSPIKAIEILNEIAKSQNPS